MEIVRDSSGSLELLSELLFTGIPSNPQQSGNGGAGPLKRSSRSTCVRTLTRQDFEELRLLAMTNHVLVRTFAGLTRRLERAGHQEGVEWVSRATESEQKRIDHALGFLSRICAAFQEQGCPVTVIKSLDHWPDLGSDLDLYTDADAGQIIEVMRDQFGAKVEGRSWGDRLANKWNFRVPGLVELVEVHVGRLGQTGEQTAVTRSLAARTRVATVGQHSFRVAAPEDRIVISTLQRMYRHFYIRLCDIADHARLLDDRLVDFEYLHALSSAAGLWAGIATYLNIISDYVEAYRGYGTALASLVKGSAKFGIEKVRFRRNFLRLPILPESLNLYAGELKTLLMRGELRNGFRLSLLPGLATAAALEQKLTGSDKGIW
jgi:Uncharacterised nucleotidyltransferase